MTAEYLSLPAADSSSTPGASARQMGSEIDAENPELPNAAPLSSLEFPRPAPDESDSERSLCEAAAGYRIRCAEGYSVGRRDRRLYPNQPAPTPRRPPLRVSLSQRPFRHLLAGGRASASGRGCRVKRLARGGARRTTVRSGRWRGARASGFRRRRPFRPRRAPSGGGRASSGCGSR